MDRSDEMSMSTATDLLALRLSSVPFHDIDQPLAYRQQQQRQQMADAGAMADDETGEEGAQRLTTMTAERWVPPAASLSFLGLIAPLTPALGLFSTRVSLLHVPASTGNASFDFTLIVLPDTLIVGNLANQLVDTSTSAQEQPPPSKWLISGEICLMGDELAIVAQSLYQQETGGMSQGPQSSSSSSTSTNQVSFTGHMNAIVAGDHVKSIWSRTSRTRATLGEALEVARDPDAWENVEDDAKLQQVSLADLEWLDVSVRIGVKSPRHPALWIRPLIELVQFKCRPSKTSEDHSRIIQVAASVPLVGQLIGIHRDQDDRTFSFFIQL
ncbi:hypothetical protein PtB15_16B309 [Puccinia triticina]|nr:hypothetical protein PtB15_16B309 [Puccinia triticina]